MGRGTAITTEIFIDRAIATHTDKLYDYSCVEVNGTQNKVFIFCVNCMEFFEQAPGSHMAGHGCRRCQKRANTKHKTTLNEFIQRATAKHGQRYDYSNITTIDDKYLPIICNTHGVFLQEGRHHMVGHGCPTCGVEARAVKCRKNIDDFIQQSKEIHGNNRYNYDHAQYKSNKIKVKLGCLDCGIIFEQTPNNHLAGNGCPTCNLPAKITVVAFIARANKIHDNMFDYTLVNNINNNTQKVELICLKCKGTFVQTVSNHLSGQGCPYCNVSKGVKKIKKWLNINGIKYTPEYRFDDCRDKIQLPFDIYLTDYNTCIEYDGEQHFRPIRFNSMTDEDMIYKFNMAKKHDDIKNKYCSDNNIRLIRIPYYNIRHINTILSKELDHIIVGDK